jgi:NAD(P)-dependent dehydrogenase (short-subunit alcohol dehydrogenase family)
MEFASRGMNVWMLDIDSQEVPQAHQRVLEVVVVAQQQQQQGSIEYRVVDVSDFNAMQKVANEVFDEKNNGKCHILMNNAGTGQGGGSALLMNSNVMVNVNVYQQVMAVNTMGPVNGCFAFLPHMRASGENGMIINTGSKQGITMPPGNLVYNMSKAALKVYTEGLEHELMMERRRRQQNKNNNSSGSGKLRAALLIPGWVNTSIVLKAMRASKSDGDKDDVDAAAAGEAAPFHEAKPAAGAWMPQQVIDFMIAELDAGRFYVVCPDNDVVDRATDNARMTWTMQDITENRPPLSRWHPDYQEAFQRYLQEYNNNNNLPPAAAAAATKK